VSSVLLVAFGASGAADAGQLGVNGALAALALMSRGTRTALAAAALAALLQWLAMRAGHVALTAPFALASGHGATSRGASPRRNRCRRSHTVLTP
jgi:urea transporter